MAALLALGAAAKRPRGVADLLGGLISRRADEMAVATLFQAAGLLVWPLCCRWAVPPPACRRWGGVGVGWGGVRWRGGGAGGLVALDQAPTDAGLWPLLGGRASGLTMLARLLVRRRPAVPPGRAVGIALGSGLLDMTANALFLLACSGDCWSSSAS